MNLKNLIVLSVVGAASAAAGITVPQMMSGSSGHDAAKGDVAESDSGNDTEGHGGNVSGHGKKDSKAAEKTDGHGKGDSHSKADTHGKTDTHGGDGHGTVKTASSTPADPEGLCFVSYGRIVTNLNEPTLTKYLSLEITVQTEVDHEDDVKAAMETRKAILSTWLTAHLADKTLDDVRGKVGVNRLRREIQDNFNSLLFSDGRERIQDILFEEFHVQ